MYYVRKCGDTIEFEIPEVTDESGRPQRIHFGGKPDQQCLDTGHLREKELHDLVWGRTRR
jgi:hypothetical protein